MPNTAVEKPRIRIVHQLARTGGTLLNRCLGSMNRVAVLSEVHPHDVFNKLVQQAAKWFGLLSNEDARWLAELKGADPGKIFLEVISTIRARAEARGDVLVIRDWTHLNFLGVPFIQSPSMTLETADILSDSFELSQTFIVRNPIDQYTSTKLWPDVGPATDINRFLDAYLEFAKFCVGNDFIRYEDLAATPDQTLIKICSQLNVPFDPTYRDRWQTYSRVTGDNLAQGKSRAYKSDAIKTLPRREIPADLCAAFYEDPRYRAAIKLLGYSDDK